DGMGIRAPLSLDKVQKERNVAFVVVVTRRIADGAERYTFHAPVTVVVLGIVAPCALAEAAHVHRVALPRALQVSLDESQSWTHAASRMTIFSRPSAGRSLKRCG